MAEVVGVAASIISVLQLTGKLASLGYGYMGSVSRARKDIANLLSELGSLAKVLTLLADYADENPRSRALRSLGGKDGPINGCHAELQKLLAKLEPAGERIDVLRSFTWPLKEKETMENTMWVERHRELFILALQLDQAALTKAIEEYSIDTNRIVRELKRDSNTLREEWEARRDLKERQDLLNWLFPGDFESRHVDIRAERKKGTGGWLLESTEFQSWKTRKGLSPLLWGSGIPGAGKTFLSSLVIDHLMTKSPNRCDGVAFVYFDYQERDQQKPVDVLASLVKQLASQLQKLPVELRNLSREKRPDTNELLSLLFATSKSFDRTFLIFDALDECDQDTQRKILLPLFQRMGENGLCLFVTSRPYPFDIQNAFRDAVKIDLAAKESDIQTYIREVIESNPEAKSLIEEGECEEQIISDLSACARGMFLLVRFHIDYLCQQTTVGEILDELEVLKQSPTEDRPLDPTYDRAIEKLPKLRNPRNLALRILAWLSKARRTLTVDELRVAVSVKPGKYKLDDKRDLPARSKLTDVTAGLVVIDEISNTVRLAHYTVQEYLEKRTDILKEAEFMITECCLTYLSFDSFRHRATTYDNHFERLGKYSFLTYAAINLRSHLSSCKESLTEKPFLDFLGQSGNVASFMEIAYEQFFPQLPRLSDFGTIPPLYIAADMGHMKAVQRLVEGGHPVHSVAVVNGSTALHRAVFGGHEKVVRYLMAKAELGPQSAGKVPIHLATDLRGRTLLHLAVMNSAHLNIAQFLVSRGAEVMARAFRDGCTPLHNCARNNNLAAAKLLLSNGANVDVPDTFGWTPLHRAADGGYTDMVDFLLENGARVNAVDRKGWTPLLRILHLGRKQVVRTYTPDRIDTVRLLVAKGADVSAADHKGRVAIHWAAESGHVETAQLLVQHGADVRALDSKRHGTLHLAVSRRDGGGDMVRFLLSEGADVRTADVFGQTPLHNAAWAGHGEVVRFLVDSGADVRALSANGKTPRDDAIRSGHWDIAQFLEVVQARRVGQDAPNKRP